MHCTVRSLLARYESILQDLRTTAFLVEFEENLLAVFIRISTLNWCSFKSVRVFGHYLSTEIVLARAMDGAVLKIHLFSCPEIFSVSIFILKTNMYQGHL